MHEHPPSRPPHAATTTGRRGLAALAAVLACAGGSLAAGPAAQAATSHHSATISAAAATVGAQLLDVSAVSPADAWAVGSYPGTAGTGQAFMAHWNGTRWTAVSTPIPAPGAEGYYLSGVDAISATDAWAVGTYNYGNQSYILHWDGTSWTVVTSPNPGGTNGTALGSVNAVSATDAWAVGSYTNSSGVQQTLTLHWDGTSWTQVTSPSPTGPGVSVNSVSAVSATDAWAVGQYINNGAEAPFIMHWDGTSWTLVTSPNPGGTHGASLGGVSADSAKDAWAVGNYRTSSGTGQTLVLHWNGTRWTKVTSPSPGGTSGFPGLAGVSAISAKDAWAVGRYYKIINGNSTSQTLIEHWNGTSWTKVTSPNPTAAPFLGNVSADSTGDAWAVGAYTSLNQQQALVLHWNGTKWTKVTSP